MLKFEMAWVFEKISELHFLKFWPIDNEDCFNIFEMTPTAQNHLHLSINSNLKLGQITILPSTNITEQFKRAI